MKNANLSWSISRNIFSQIKKIILELLHFLSKIFHKNLIELDILFKYIALLVFFSFLVRRIKTPTIEQTSIDWIKRGNYVNYSNWMENDWTIPFPVIIILQSSHNDWSFNRRSYRNSSWKGRWYHKISSGSQTQYQCCKYFILNSLVFYIVSNIPSNFSEINNNVQDRSSKSIRGRNVETQD